MNYTKKEIKLTRQELLVGCMTGLSRRLESIESNRKPRFEEQYEGQLLLMDQLAACSEMACAKILGLYYPHTINTFHVADIGKNIEVRYSNTGRLKVRKDDENIFIHSMSGGFKKFIWHGFVWSEDAKRQEFYSDPNNIGKPAYFIPQEKLSSVTMDLWRYLDLQLKGSISISELTSNKDRFIDRVKHYINNHPKGSLVEFNGDYEKIKKIEAII